MREIAFSIIDLHGKHWAQLLDVDRPVKHLIPVLVDQLGLPRELNYVLVPRGAEFPLNDYFSLAQLYVPAGAELFLRPLRDQLLKMLLDKLYDEVKDNIKDQVIDQAKDKLMKILDLDPAYPDPLGLKQRLLGISPQLPIQKEGTPRQFRPTPKKSPVGWIIAGVLGGGAVLVVGGIAVIALFALLLKGLTSAPGGNNGGLVPTEVVLGTGDVQVTLRWSAPVDLDLHVIDPYGEEIWYDHRSANSGGELDVDANAGCNSMLERPVENVFWPYGGAPGGNYQVYVVYYMDCGFSSPVNYEVTIKQNNQVFDINSGTVSAAGESQLVTSFSR
jgi:hypothetical protein